MQLRDKWSDHIHVLHSIVQSLESFITLDVFVLSEIWSSLVLLHVLKKLFEVISNNVLPKSLLPGLELTINDGYKIPQLFELNELVLAINEFLLLGPLQFEELLKSLKLLGLFLHHAGLFVVLANLSVGLVNSLRRGHSLARGHIRLELHSVLENFDLELTDASLDIVRFLGLKG